MQGQLFLVGGAGALGVDNLYKLLRGKRFFLKSTLCLENFRYLQVSMRWGVFNLKDKEKLPKEILLSYKYNGVEETLAVPLKW